MKIIKRYQIPLAALMFQTTIIARFGPARLVRHDGRCGSHWPSARSGKHELIGGTQEHRAAAREWCSLFAPEIVFDTGGIPEGTARQERPISKSSRRASVTAIKLVPC